MKKYLLAAGVSLLSINMSMAWELCHEVEQEHGPVVAIVDYTDIGRGETRVSFYECEGVDAEVALEDRVLDKRTEYDLSAGRQEPRVCGYAKEGAEVVVGTVKISTLESFETRLELDQEGEYVLEGGGYTARVRHVADSRKDSWYGALMTAIRGESPCELPEIYLVEIY